MILEFIPKDGGLGVGRIICQSNEDYSQLNAVIPSNKGIAIKLKWDGMALIFESSYLSDKEAPAKVEVTQGEAVFSQPTYATWALPKLRTEAAKKNIPNSQKMNQVELISALQAKDRERNAKS